MPKEEIKEQEAQDITEEEPEEEIDVTKLSDEELKTKSAKLRGAGPKKEIKKEVKKEIKTETKIEPSSQKKDEKIETKTEVSADDLSKLKKQIQDKEDFIQRQGKEIGELRKSVKELQSAGGETEKGGLPQAEEIKDPILNFEKRKIAIKNAIPNIEEIKGDIVDLVRKKGQESEENISLFLSNPYTADLALLQYWANEVIHEKSKTNIETLTKENEDLKKRLQTAGKDVLKNIEKATLSTKTLTAKTGAEAEEESIGITEDQIPYLSDEQLKELRKKLKK